ncbi:Uncharacterised protein [Mycobacteroides abscessus]|nr:Uncharacterised protein [Mycobacteroides abscessus]
MTPRRYVPVVGTSTVHDADAPAVVNPRTSFAPEAANVHASPAGRSTTVSPDSRVDSASTRCLHVVSATGASSRAGVTTTW